MKRDSSVNKDLLSSNVPDTGEPKIQEKQEIPAFVELRLGERDSKQIKHLVYRMVVKCWEGMRWWDGVRVVDTMNSLVPGGLPEVTIEQRGRSWKDPASRIFLGRDPKAAGDRGESEHGCWHRASRPWRLQLPEACAAVAWGDPVQRVPVATLSEHGRAWNE